jgi:branched-chain amino acid transport system ATP-binding protein
MSGGDILLSARDLSVRFGGVLAVNKVSFDVRRGEVFTLIGPNGAGKTTVFNLISRIYTPTSRPDHCMARPARTVALAMAPARDRGARHERAPSRTCELFMSMRRPARTCCSARHTAHGAAAAGRACSSRGHAARRRSRLREKALQVIELRRPAAPCATRWWRSLPVRRAQAAGDGARALASRTALLLLDEPSSGLNVEETARDGRSGSRTSSTSSGVSVLLVEHDMSLVIEGVGPRARAEPGRSWPTGTPREVQRRCAAWWRLTSARSTT